MQELPPPSARAIVIHDRWMETNRSGVIGSLIKLLAKYRRYPLEHYR